MPCRPAALSDQTVALNSSRSSFSVIDLLFQLLSILRLCAWGALGLYLLWRAGLAPRAIGLARPRLKIDLSHGVGLAALIGLPGLALYLVGNALGFNLTVVPSAIDDHWWRVPALMLYALANSGAEEIIVVAYLISRLRRLGLEREHVVACSALLRGQLTTSIRGWAAASATSLMGLVFGRYWQRTGQAVATADRACAHRHRRVRRLHRCCANTCRGCPDGYSRFVNDDDRYGRHGAPNRRTPPPSQPPPPRSTTRPAATVPASARRWGPWTATRRHHVSTDPVRRRFRTPVGPIRNLPWRRGGSPRRPGPAPEGTEFIRRDGRPAAPRPAPLSNRNRPGRRHPNPALPVPFRRTRRASTPALPRTRPGAPGTHRANTGTVRRRAQAATGVSASAPSRPNQLGHDVIHVRPRLRSRKHRHWGRRFADRPARSSFVGIGGIVYYVDSSLTRVDALTDYPGRIGDTPGTNWLLVGSDSRAGLTPEQEAALATGGESRPEPHRHDHDDPHPERRRGDDDGQPAARLVRADSRQRRGQAQRGVRIRRAAPAGADGRGRDRDCTSTTTPRSASAVSPASSTPSAGSTCACRTRSTTRSAGIDLRPAARSSTGPQALGFVRTRATALRRPRPDEQPAAVHVGAAEQGDQPVRPASIRSGWCRWSTTPRRRSRVDEGDHIWNLAAAGLGDARRLVTTTVPVGGFEDTDGPATSCCGIATGRRSSSSAWRTIGRSRDGTASPPCPW